LLLGSAIEFKVGQWGWKVFSMANFYLSVDFYAVLMDFCPVPGRPKSGKFLGVGFLLLEKFNGKVGILGHNTMP